MKVVTDTLIKNHKSKTQYLYLKKLWKEEMNKPIEGKGRIKIRIKINDKENRKVKRIKKSTLNSLKRFKKATFKLDWQRKYELLNPEMNNVDITTNITEIKGL